MQLTAADLRRIADLLDRREQLRKELDAVNQELRNSGWEGEAPPETKGRSGQLKDAIISLVKSAGSSGITVQKLAQALSRPTQRIYVWYHMTGRKIPNIHRDGSTLHWRE